MGDSEKYNARNDFFEVAPPFHVFKIHGYDVDFVSSKGGEVSFSRDPLGIISYTIKYEGFGEKVENTLKPSQVDPSEYWGVFSGGGYGVMFDVASNKEIQTITSKIYEANEIIVVGGHGSASITNVKLSTGDYLVRGNKVAGFSNSTETSKPWAKLGTLLPFLIEDQLNNYGAIALNKETLKGKREVVIDQRIVSTMLLPSAAMICQILNRKNLRRSSYVCI